MSLFLCLFKHGEFDTLFSSVCPLSVIQQGLPGPLGPPGPAGPTGEKVMSWIVILWAQNHEGGC